LYHDEDGNCINVIACIFWKLKTLP